MGEYVPKARPTQIAIESAMGTGQAVECGLAEPRKPTRVELEEHLATIKARLTFLLANYFRRNPDGSYRVKPMLRDDERREVLTEVRVLQGDGEIIEELIARSTRE